MNNSLYPSFVQLCIDKFTDSLFDFIKSSCEEISELPSKKECRVAVEETFGDMIIEKYNSGDMNTLDDVDDLLFSLFNNKKHYQLLLKFSTKATIIHAKNLF